MRNIIFNCASAVVYNNLECCFATRLLVDFPGTTQPFSSNRGVFNKTIISLAFVGYEMIIDDQEQKLVFSGLQI